MTSAVLDREEVKVEANGHRAGKYLTFRLDAEEFGIRVLKVREIMGVQDITAVPQTAAWIKGVINLRGKVVPVTDLRLKFGLPEAEHTSHTCIIVVQHGASSMQTGIIVDEVCEVLSIAEGDIEDTPDFGDGSATPFLLGLAKVKGKVKILLEIDQVLANTELHTLDQMLQT
jgi:purine-binding chemotaxis protein CheW